MYTVQVNHFCAEPLPGIVFIIYNNAYKWMALIAPRPIFFIAAAVYDITAMSGCEYFLKRNFLQKYTDFVTYVKF